MAITCSLMKGLNRTPSHSVWEVVHALLRFTGIKSQPNLCCNTSASPLVSVSAMKNTTRELLMKIGLKCEGGKQKRNRARRMERAKTKERKGK